MRWRLLLLPCLLVGAYAAPSPETTEEIKPITPVSVEQLNRTSTRKSSSKQLPLIPSTIEHITSDVPPISKKFAMGNKIVSSKQRASRDVPAKEKNIAKQLGPKGKVATSSNKTNDKSKQQSSSTVQPVQPTREDDLHRQMETMKGSKAGPSEDRLAMVNTSSPLHVVSDRFLSLSLDPNMIAELPWADPSTVRLARLLSPAWFKICPDINNGSAGFNLSMYQWAAVNHFTSEAGLEQMWDSAMFARAARYWLKSGGLSDQNTTQLKVPAVHEFPPSPQHVGFSVRGPDLADLGAINSIFSRYSSAAVTVAGPEIKFFSDYQDMLAFAKWLNASANNISVVSWNPSTLIGRYLSTEHSDLLRLEQSVVKGVLEQTSHDDKALWVGDMSLRWEDNANTAATFSSTLLWLDRLGAMAASGVSVAFQPALLPLHERGVLAAPSPEYWTAVLHKRLASPRVLHVRSRCEGDAPCRLYAHCTPSGENSHYLAGAVTVMGINLGGSELHGNVSGWPGEHAESVHQYILTGKLADKDIYLNGNKLKIDPETGELPAIRPNIISFPGKLIMPPYSMAFWVFPGIGAKACQNEEFGRGKRLSTGDFDEDQTTHLALLFPVNDILGGEDVEIKSKQKRCHHDLYIPAAPLNKRRTPPELSLFKTKVPIGQCPPGCRLIEKSHCDFQAIKIKAPGCSTSELLQRLLDLTKMKRKGNCYCDQLDGTTESYEGSKKISQGDYPKQRLNLLQEESRVKLYPGNLPPVDGPSELPMEMTSYDIPGETTEYGVQIPTGTNVGAEYESPEIYGVLHHQEKATQYNNLHHQNTATEYNANQYTEINEQPTEYTASDGTIEQRRLESEQYDSNNYQNNAQETYSNRPENLFDTNTEEYKNKNQQNYDETTNAYEISPKYDKDYDKNTENLVSDYKQIINYKTNGERRTTRSSLPYGTHFTEHPATYDARDDGSTYQQYGQLYSSVMTSSERYPPQYIQESQPTKNVLYKQYIQDPDYVTDTSKSPKHGKQAYYPINIPNEGYKIPVVIKYETKTNGVGHGVIHITSSKYSAENREAAKDSTGHYESLDKPEFYGPHSNYNGGSMVLTFDENNGRYVQDVARYNHKSDKYKEEITTSKYPIFSPPQVLESNKRIYSNANYNEGTDAYKSYYNSVTQENINKKIQSTTENVIKSNNISTMYVEKLSNNEYKPSKYYVAQTEATSQGQMEYEKTRDSSYRKNQQYSEQDGAYSKEPTEKYPVYETTLPKYPKYQPNIREHDTTNLKYGEPTERDGGNYASSKPSGPNYRHDDTDNHNIKYQNKNEHFSGDEKYRSEQQRNYAKQSNEETWLNYPPNKKYSHQNLNDKYNNNETPSKYAENDGNYKARQNLQYEQTGKYNSNQYAPNMYSAKQYDLNGRKTYSHTEKSQYPQENVPSQPSFYTERYDSDEHSPDEPEHIISDPPRTKYPVNEYSTQANYRDSHGSTNEYPGLLSKSQAKNQYGPPNSASPANYPPEENTTPRRKPTNMDQSYYTEYTEKYMPHERIHNYDDIISNTYAIESQIKTTLSDNNSVYKDSNNKYEAQQPLKTYPETKYNTETPSKYYYPTKAHDDPGTDSPYYRDFIKGRQQNYDSSTKSESVYNREENKPITQEIPKNCLPYILRNKNNEMTSHQYGTLTKNKNYEVSSNEKENYHNLDSNYRISNPVYEQDTVNYASNYKYNEEQAHTNERTKYGSNDYGKSDPRVLERIDYSSEQRPSDYSNQQPQHQYQYKFPVSEYPGEHEGSQYVQNNSNFYPSQSNYSTDTSQYHHSSNQVVQDRLLQLNKNIFPEAQPYDQYQKYNPFQRQIYKTQKLEYSPLQHKTIYERPHEYQIPNSYPQYIQNQRYDDIYDSVPHRQIPGLETRPAYNKLHTRPSGPSLSGLLEAALGKLTEKRPYQQPPYHSIHDNKLGYGYQQYEDKPPYYHPYDNKAYDNLNILGRRPIASISDHRTIYDQPSYDNNNMPYGLRIDKPTDDAAREVQVDNYKLTTDRGDYQDKYVQDKSNYSVAVESYSTLAPKKYQETVEYRQPEYKTQQRSDEDYPLPQIPYYPQKPQQAYPEVPILSEECVLRCAGSKICDQSRFYKFVESLLRQFTEKRETTNFQKLRSDDYLISNGYSDNKLEQGFVKSEKLLTGLRDVLASNRDEETKLKLGSVYVECPTECSVNPCIDHFGRKIKIIMSVISWLKDCFTKR